MTDEHFMRTAIELAEHGRGFVSPNPMVGAVIVKNGEIIGQGYHEKFGGPHAERNALSSCRTSPEGATIYVTLEPCCHFGKTPPCTDAIIESGINRVVVGIQDPNELVAGAGIETLRARGIEVVKGVLEEDCGRLNEVFFHYIKMKRPYVILKFAMTLDGKIAAYTGKSKWITGEAARMRVHQDRRNYSSIMVGVGTVIADDPLLTCRIENGKNPARIICDSNLRTPLDSQIVKTAERIPTFIATARDSAKIKAYTDAGCKIIIAGSENGRVDLNRLIAELGRIGIDSVIIEGGGELNWSALDSGIVNRVQAYVAPKILGGAGAKSPVGGIGADSPDKAFQLVSKRITVLDEDILIEYEVRNVCGDSLAKELPAG